MRDLGMFPVNVMFADATGNSWYVHAGRTPKRPDGFDWSRPVSGNSSETAWRGLHPLADLVQITNPPTGYMQNNNLAPNEMTLPPALVNAEAYPAYVFNDRPGRSTVRGDRTNEVLSQAQNFTVPDAIDHALDEKWLATETWIAVLRRAAEAEAARVQTWDQADRDFLQALLSFDGHARADSASALKYYLWRQEIYNRQIDAQTRAAMSVQWTDNLGAVVPADVMLGSIGAAATTIQEVFGRADATLGDLVRIGNGETDYPVGGISLAPLKEFECLAEFCEMTARAFEPPLHEGPIKPFRVQFGSRALRLVVFTDPIQSFSLLNFGQSTDPESPHFDDQARLLTSQRKLKPVYFERDQLAGHIKGEVTLVYEPVAP
jgi:acyl-homoserine lactone acylase PvdQ